MQLLTLGKKGTAADLSCIILGRLGMSARCISEKTGLSPGQIYGRLRMAGISVKDYRDGRTDFARKIITAATEEAGHAIEDIRAQIKQLLPPTETKHEDKTG